MPRLRTRLPGPPRTLRQAALIAILFAIACDDATGPDVFPPPAGPPTPLRIARVVSSLSATFGEQAAEYTWDGDRLVAFSFDPNLGDDVDATIRKDFLYHDDGRPRGHDTYIRDGAEWRLSGIVRYAYVDGDVLVEAYTETLDERGSVIVSSVGFGYDEHGRITEIRNGPEVDTFTYDRNGDIVRMRSDDIRFGVQVRTLGYGDAWNPFADLPPLAGTDRGIFAPEDASLHLATSFANAVEGEPAAATGTAVITTNEFGYPTRREWQLRNTADPPGTVTTIVAEYEYLDP